MPSGKTHLRFELALLPIVLLVVLIALRVELAQLAIFAFAYLFSSLWLSPDLDLSKSASRRRWRSMAWIWEPYSRIFKHRGMSHHIILGPVSRVFYLVGILWLILRLYSYLNFPIPLEILDPIKLSSWLILAMGLYVPNAIHTFLDALTTLAKRLRNNHKERSNVHKVRQH